MKIIKLLICFVCLIEFSKEITAYDFNHITPNIFLKGSKVSFQIMFNEGIDRWDNSTSIKIGDNQIPLENCYRSRDKYDKNDGTGSYVIYSIICENVLMDGDNTEISYGGIVQLGSNLNVSFVNEFSINSLTDYLTKDYNDYIYIGSDIAAGLKYRTVKIGNYTVNCDNYYYGSASSNCHVKIDKEGTYNLTIDGKECYINKGEENEKIASITVYEYKITELPTFTKNTIEASEELILL